MVVAKVARVQLFPSAAMNFFLCPLGKVEFKPYERTLHPPALRDDPNNGCEGLYKKEQCSLRCKRKQLSDPFFVKF